MTAIETAFAPQETRTTEMALLDTHRTSSQPAVFAGLSAYVRDTLSALVAWNRARRTRAYLERLSAAELDDIGLTRGDIDKITSIRRF